MNRDGITSLALVSTLAALVVMGGYLTLRIHQVSQRSVSATVLESKIRVEAREALDELAESIQGGECPNVLPPKKLTVTSTTVNLRCKSINDQNGTPGALLTAHWSAPKVGSIQIWAKGRNRQPYWNSWVKNDGPDEYTYSGTPCTGNERVKNGESEWIKPSCIHLGERLVFAIPGVSSCNDLQVHDTLGAFEWGCRQSRLGQNQFEAFTRRLYMRVGLAGLLDQSRFRKNQVIVQRRIGSVIEEVFSTKPSIWWRNKVIPIRFGIVGNNEANLFGDDGTTTTGGYDIYVASESGSTDFRLNLNTKKPFSIVVMGNHDVTLNYRNVDGSLPERWLLYTALTSRGFQPVHFLWLEGGTLNGPFESFVGNFPRIANTNLRSSAGVRSFAYTHGSYGARLHQISTLGGWVGSQSILTHVNTSFTLNVGRGSLQSHLNYTSLVVPNRSLWHLNDYSESPSTMTRITYPDPDGGFSGLIQSDHSFISALTGSIHFSVAGSRTVILVNQRVRHAGSVRHAGRANIDLVNMGLIDSTPGTSQLYFKAPFGPQDLTAWDPGPLPRSTSIFNDPSSKPEVHYLGTFKYNPSIAQIGGTYLSDGLAKLQVSRLPVPTERLAFPVLNVGNVAEGGPNDIPLDLTKSFIYAKTYSKVEWMPGFGVRLDQLVANSTRPYITLCASGFLGSQQFEPDSELGCKPRASDHFSVTEVPPNPYEILGMWKYPNDPTPQRCPSCTNEVTGIPYYKNFSQKSVGDTATVLENLLIPKPFDPEAYRSNPDLPCPDFMTGRGSFLPKRTGGFMHRYALAALDPDSGIPLDKNSTGLCDQDGQTCQITPYYGSYQGEGDWLSCKYELPQGGSGLKDLKIVFRSKLIYTDNSQFRQPLPNVVVPTPPPPKVCKRVVHNACNVGVTPGVETTPSTCEALRRDDCEVSNGPAFGVDYTGCRKTGCNRRSGWDDGTWICENPEVCN